jgi:PAS domain S-box-containing protein
MSRKPTYEELENRIQELENAERERAEREAPFKDELSRWRLLIDQSRDGIFILDDQARVYEANRRFADMLGYPMDELERLFVWDWDVRFNKEELVELHRTVDRTGHHFETQQRRKDGTIIDVEVSNNGVLFEGKKFVFCICRDITERKRTEKERDRLLLELRQAMAEIRTLKGILPICSFCNKIRDEKGRWEKIDLYIEKNSEAEFTHSLCPECLKKDYPDYSAPEE